MSPEQDVRKLDTHFHIELPHPDWKTCAVTSPIRHSNASKCILAVITPDPSSEGVGEAGRRLARAINMQTLDTVRSKESKDKFTWFASLPDWSDVEGTIREVEWALGEADADGVVVMPTYQDRLLGDESFQPIWDKLNEYHAAVLVHPTSLNICTGFCDFGPQSDYPIATTRTAIDLVLSKTLATHPDVKIILSHAGGTLPFLPERALDFLDNVGVSEEESRQGLKQLWVDVAMNTSNTQVHGLLSYIPPDKILYGADWPYA